jgi:predicted ATPase
MILHSMITLHSMIYLALQVVLLAAAPPTELFVAPADSAGDKDEVFAFDRTVSRLMEMQCQE